MFAQVVEDEQHQRLLDVAECVRQVFVSHGVCMPDTRELHPHLTIAKLSKAPRTKGKVCVFTKVYCTVHGLKLILSCVHKHSCLVSL